MQRFPIGFAFGFVLLSLLFATPAAAQSGNRTGCTAATCGARAPSGCYCDSACFFYGDCCIDILPACYRPAIHSVTPSLIDTIGASLAIAGQNFSSTDAMTISAAATVDGNPCQISERSRTLINCFAGPGAGIGLPVVVTTTVSAPLLGTHVLSTAETTPMTISYNRPIIHSLSAPLSSTSGGEPLTITGTNFGPPDEDRLFVDVDGNDCAVGSSEHTKIVCELPAGEGTRQVVVTVAGQRSDPAGFTYAAPLIESISGLPIPTSGAPITITGRNFGFTPTVRVGDSPCPITGSPTHTEIVCSAPAGVGAAEVIVAVEGQPSNGYPVSYKAPFLGGISPPGGPTTGGFTVTLTGSDFGTSGAIVVFGGSTVTPDTQSHHQITITAPAGVGDPVSVKVQVAGSESNATIFTYDGPEVAAVSPAAIPTSGALLEITGTNFGLQPKVIIDDTLLCGQTESSHTRIVCAAPAGTGIAHTLLVLAGQVSSSGATFGYLPPHLQSISPTHGGTAGGIAVALSGSNFGTTGATVTIGDRPCPLVSQSHTGATCVLPAGEGVGALVQLTVGEQPSNTLTFDYDPPVITGAHHLPADGTIAVHGVNFGLTPSVSIDNLPCPLVVPATHTTLTCSAPDTGALTRSIVVTAGGQPSEPFSLTMSAPSIASLDYASAPTAGGVPITINGANFGASGNSVTIGAALCPVTTETATTIVCSLPPGDGRNRDLVVTTGGRASSPFPFHYDPPELTALDTPSAITAGGTVASAYGTSLGASGGTITVGGEAANIVRQTHSRIDFILPSGEGRAIAVVATVGNQISNTLTFDYLPPIVSSVGVIPAAGGVIDVLGLNFGLSPTVTIDSRPCPLAGPSSHTALTCFAPPDDGAPSHSLVVTAGTQSSNSFAVTYESLPPSIAALSAPSAPTAGGVLLTIMGLHFAPSGNSVTVGAASCSVTLESRAEIVCTLPAGQGRDVPVIVTAGEQSSTPFLFHYDPPVLTMLSGSSTTAGGELLTIDGNNLGTAAAGVTLGTRPCDVVTQWHTRVTCTVPEGEGAARAVRVTVAGQTSNDLFFTYDRPVIAGVDPAVIPTTGGPLAIHGTSFGSNPDVRIGTSPCTVVTTPSHTEITCTAPPGTGAAHEMTVTAAAQVSLPFPLSYAPPQLASISSPAASTAGGTPLTLIGANFGASGATVTVGGRDCPVESQTHTTVVCTLPAGDGRDQEVELTVGGQSSNVLLFHYPAPQIVTIDPASSPLAGGIPLTIEGLNFGASGALVTIGGARCPLTSQTHTRITCTVPAGSGTNVPVTVTAGTQVSNEVRFDYLGPEVRIEPELIAFGSVDVGTSSAALLRITNDGASPLTIISATASGPNAAEFSFTLAGLPSLIVAPFGGFVDAEVRFAPLVAGERSATLTILSDDPARPVVNIALSGTGAAPYIEVSPPAIRFDPILVGDLTSSFVFIGNSGNAPLVVSAISITGSGADRFTYNTIDPLPIVVAPGSQHVMLVYYAPVAVTTDVATLTIEGGGMQVEVPLEGAGGTAELAVMPSVVDFGGQLIGRRSEGHDIVIRNTGTLPMVVRADLGGPDAGAFEVIGQLIFLAPGEESSFHVYFTAVTIGGASASLHVSMQGEPEIGAVVTLEGVGLSALLNVVPLSIDFGVLGAPAVAVPQSVDITNLSGDAIFLADPVITGSPGFNVTPVAAPLPSGDTRTMEIGFASETAGEYAAQLTIASADASVPSLAIDLAAHVVKRLIQVTPPNVQFKKTEVGQWSEPAIVTVTNRSDVPVAIERVVAASPAFEIRNVDYGPIAPRGSARFEVVFRPPAAGQHETTIEVTLAGSAIPDQVIRARGMGAKK